MSEKLLPCPFCGDFDAECAESAVPNVHGGQKYAVFCNACFCEGPTDDIRERAIAAWNRRELESASQTRGGEAVAWMRTDEPVSWNRSFISADAKRLDKGDTYAVPLYRNPDPRLADALHYLRMGLENLTLGNGVHMVDFRNAERILAAPSAGNGGAEGGAP